MAISEDLINFDLIETHKENIQSLPGGRSARQLASILSPLSSSRGLSSPTLDETKSLNDAIRQEYEIELQSIADSDDPLDIYDRYVKWTLNAYPSAQSTPQSKLLPLLERATKAFLTSSHYKNDPRYLKLWLHYIRFFCNSQRETFAFMARHHIGEGLGLFYEEFAAWLESAGRWSQAEEVYKLGVEREARPVERLMRRYDQFQKRFEARPQSEREPSSPALPTVRPALAAKIDPFDTNPRSDELQAAQRPSSTGGPSAARSGKPKMAIFSDAGNETPPAMVSATQGWDSIGSIQDRKKENKIEARPWAGETLKAGKKVGTGEKMAIFKDLNSRKNDSNKNQISHLLLPTDVVNQRTGRAERVFVNVEAVYPNSQEEFSFEELRAMRRGWACREWSQKAATTTKTESRVQRSSRRSPKAADTVDVQNLSHEFQQKVDLEDSSAQSTLEANAEARQPRQKKMKIREVKQEAQTVKTRLESPTGRGKIRRKISAEPTMTFHSKAATDEIYSMFNQPQNSLNRDDTESGDDTDFGDDDYSTAGESTGTGRISGTTSEYGEDTTASLRTGEENTGSQPDSVSPWSEFTSSKHLPKSRNKDRHPTNEEQTDHVGSSQNQTQISGFDTQAIDAIANQDFGEFDTKVIAAMAGDFDEGDEEDQDEEELETPISPSSQRHVEVSNKPKYVPLPPVDYEPTPLRPFRDATEIAQHRLPFMTPIVEKTESSLAPSTIFNENDYFNSKTPSRYFLAALKERPTRQNESTTSMKTCDQYKQLKKYASIIANTKAKSSPRKTGDKTLTQAIPPILKFPGNSRAYAIKRLLGRGAFAPVYLADSYDLESDTSPSSSSSSSRSALEAIKTDHPPINSTWEFHILHILTQRLTTHSPVILRSLIHAHACHVFADEAYLVLDYHTQGTLLDLTNWTREERIKTGKAAGEGVEEVLAMFFAVELLRTVEAIHAVGILHGDLKGDNCLVRLEEGDLSESYGSAAGAGGDDCWQKKGITLIDFGRGIDHRAFQPDVQFIADWPADKHDCAEVRGQKPWVWQIDHFGVAGVAHNLLFGKMIETIEVGSPSSLIDAPLGVGAAGAGAGVGNIGRKEFKLREPLKRYWQQELWTEAFRVLVNPGLVGEEPAVREKLRAVRSDMEAWLREEGERRDLRGAIRRAERLIAEKSRGRK